VPVSVELLADYGGEGFQAEMAKILATEYLTFMGNATLNANGSGQPYGILTQLYNTTTSPAPRSPPRAASVERSRTSPPILARSQGWTSNQTTTPPVLTP
jgi:hypothetical protein